ncbi:Pyridoxal phosphate-dependent transferase, major domain [Fusarium oxysporum f. sp. vasinfectum]|nr:Pyridoxal phosphate-dependent transferase, major domain [Fusarium oxysporum f. sp. vasinfectum]
MPSFVESPVRTEIPGPVSKASSKRLDAIFDARAVHFVVDYDNIVDVDGNKYLDVYAQIASIPVGYNNDTLIEAAKSPK